MTFEELLTHFAPQSSEAWERLASEEWRGKTPADFAIDLANPDMASGARPSIAPFYALPQVSSVQDVATTNNADSSRPPRRWTLLSDLRIAESESPSDPQQSTFEQILVELEGGAEGFSIEAGRLNELVGSKDAIRFDFIQVHLENGATGKSDTPVLETLSSIVPVEQSAEFALRLPFPSGDQEEAVRLLSRFPRLAWTVDLRGESALDVVADLRRHLSIYLSESWRHARHLLLPRLTIWYPGPANYVAGVALPEALRRVFRKEIEEQAPEFAASAPELVVVTQAVGASTRESYLIDATVRITAAVAGGVGAGLVSPFGPSDRFRREARNLQQVLALESGLATVRDATRGAALFEAATVTLSEH